jgi:hypothetical protein
MMMPSVQMWMKLQMGPMIKKNDNLTNLARLVYIFFFILLCPFPCHNITPKNYL